MAASTEDSITEGERLLEEAAAAKLKLKLTGGVAIAKICRSATENPQLRREYSDIDFIGRSRAAGEIERFFDAIGYRADNDFNSLHGEHRMFFTDPNRDCEADVFLDEVRACHVLDLRDRIDIWPSTVPPADLLLSKLQVVETNEKDFQDIFALLLDHEVTDDDSGVGLPRIVDLCSKDWGWWRTVTMVIERSIAAGEERLSESEAQIVAGRLRRILAAIDDAPKSRRWKLRSKLGDRVPWHEEPEEVAHS